MVKKRFQTKTAIGSHTQFQIRFLHHRIVIVRSLSSHSAQLQHTYQNKKEEKENITHTHTLVPYILM